MLLRFVFLKTLERPTRRNIRSVYNFVHRTVSLPEWQRSYLLHKDDLVVLAPGQQNGWLTGVIGDIMVKISKQWTQVCGRK